MSSAEVIARFDELFERHYPTKTAESAARVDRDLCFWRVENRAAAAQLAADGGVVWLSVVAVFRDRGVGCRYEAAVAAEVASALRISQGLAVSRLRYARAMRERLPKVAEVFKAGDIDYRMFRTLVYRTDLITDRRRLGGRG